MTKSMSMMLIQVSCDSSLLAEKRYIYMGLFDTEVEAARLFADNHNLLDLGSSSLIFIVKFRYFCLDVVVDTYEGDLASPANNDASRRDLELSLTIDSSSHYNEKWNESSINSGNLKGADPKLWILLEVVEVAQRGREGTVVRLGLYRGTNYQ
ncbi:hypothetical protein QQ045_024385 [Rhodiola kirilowii]